jgi:hypothetical protein
LAAPRASIGRRLSEVAIITVGVRWQATAWEAAYATVWLLSGRPATSTPIRWLSTAAPPDSVNWVM